MPREEVLRCDAPGCDEIGTECLVACGGKTYEVILGPAHRDQLQQIARWGRVVRAAGRTPASKRRGTDEARLESLLDIDKR